MIKNNLPQSVKIAIQLLVGVGVWIILNLDQFDENPIRVISQGVFILSISIFMRYVHLEESAIYIPLNSLDNVVNKIKELGFIQTSEKGKVLTFKKKGIAWYARKIKIVLTDYHIKVHCPEILVPQLEGFVSN